LGAAEAVLWAASAACRGAAAVQAERRGRQAGWRATCQRWQAYSFRHDAEPAAGAGGDLEARAASRERRVRKGREVMRPVVGKLELAHRRALDGAVRGRASCLCGVLLLVMLGVSETFTRVMRARRVRRGYREEAGALVRHVKYLYASTWTRNSLGGDEDDGTPRLHDGQDERAAVVGARHPALDLLPLPAVTNILLTTALLCATC
jgi:hypothetical protein